MGRGFTPRAGFCLAGFAVGQLFVIVLDRLIGGPGPFVAFGL